MQTFVEGFLGLGSEERLAGYADCFIGGALALEGNPETRRRLERAGVDVRIYKGDELSRKGDGGATCLTRPLLRG